MLSSMILLAAMTAAPAEAGAKREASAPPTATRPDPELAAKVRRLIRQLDADQLQLRDQAEDELLQLGPAVLEFLPKEFDGSKPEVEQRVGRIRQKLQRSAASTTMAPSTITLQGKLPLSKILAAIQEQTGNKIVDARREAADQAPDPELNVQFNKTPFWQTIDHVLDEAGLAVYPYGDAKAIKVVPQNRPQRRRAGRASYHGPFRFEPVAIVAEQDLRNPANRSLKIKFDVWWEPRIAPVTLRLAMSGIHAIDERGKPLAVSSPDADIEVPVEPDAMAKELILPLALPPREVRQIAQLKGTLNALVPGKMETFEFKDLEKAKSVEKRVAGVTVTLEGARKNNKVWQLSTLIRFDEASGALASHRHWIFGNPAFLMGKDGKQITADSSEATRQSPNEVGIAYLFAAERPLAEYTFVYQTPGMIFSSSMEFELKGIDLP